MQTPIQTLTKRLRYLPISLLVLLTVGTATIPAAQAEPCTYQCDTNQIRFMPGQPITIEFINNTDGNRQPGARTRYRHALATPTQ